MIPVIVVKKRESDISHSGFILIFDLRMLSRIRGMYAESRVANEEKSLKEKLVILS
jgi:hypothetical protein